MLGISSVAAQLAASQGGLRSMSDDDDDDDYSPGERIGKLETCPILKGDRSLIHV
jgi:hypothetical protein